MTGHAGFDASGYPNDEVMAELKRSTNFEWCGFYLAPAPSHPDAGWMTKRALLLTQGWGLAPIFVGQQTTGPGSRVVTATRGTEDGTSAVQLMLHAGFPSGSFVYLDLENGPPFGTAQQGYVGAWVDAVIAAGFSAGVYCSFLFAGAVAKLRPQARIWAFHVRTVAAHAVAGSSYPTPGPSTSGFSGASIWQHDDSAEILVGGKRLLVDLDSAAMADPSAPEPAARPVQVAIPPPTPAARMAAVQQSLDKIMPTAQHETWLATLERHVVDFFSLD